MIYSEQDTLTTITSKPGFTSYTGYTGYTIADLLDYIELSYSRPGRPSDVIAELGLSEQDMKLLRYNLKERCSFTSRPSYRSYP